MPKRAAIALLFLLTSLTGQSQITATNRYTFALFMQAYDSSGVCECHMSSENEDGLYLYDCNALSNVMVNIYRDSNLISTYYTDNSGFCPKFALGESKYRLFLIKQNFDTTSILIDFTAADKRNRISHSGNCTLFSHPADNFYSLCIIMYPDRKKHGVKLVPQKEIKN